MQKPTSRIKRKRLATPPTSLDNSSWQITASGDDGEDTMSGEAPVSSPLRSVPSQPHGKRSASGKVGLPVVLHETLLGDTHMSPSVVN
jgi:hypothetical protein